MRIAETVYKTGEHELILRNPEEEDAELLLTYLKTVNAETKFLLKEPEEITLTLEEERQFIRNQNDAESNLMILGFLDGKYVGNCSFNGMGSFRYRHRVSMGIALYQEFTGMGIGKIMIQKLLETAKENGLEQVELEVMADNENAVSLYQKMGFKICGTFPHNMKYKDGTYADAYWMVKEL